MILKKMFLVAAMAALSGCATGDVNLDIGPLFSTKNEPAATQAMRWDNAPASEGWTEATLAALDSHGQNLVNTTPADIDVWCPGYEKADKEGRKAFWTGLLSALSKHESTWQPAVVGGGGRWFGLVQISPATARYHGCRAGSGEALKDGAANLSCAVRILDTTVPRDGVVAAGMRGVAADWGPFHQASKREDMRAWMLAQPYCQG
ncbi:MAG: transglycosylase SLT domain-containing protein [Maritimibacter sp.]|nr:transglycosylase SLT domain-containing protein [Maritimibacter sp.]